MNLEEVIARMLDSECEALLDISVGRFGVSPLVLERILATPEGKALEALVEAAVVWSTVAAGPAEEERASDALVEAVDAYLALGKP